MTAPRPPRGPARPLGPGGPAGAPTGSAGAVGAPTGEARDTSGVTVDVAPGGGLRSLTIPDRALRMGNDALAVTILGLVRTATGQANQRARIALAEQLRGLSDPDLTALGVGTDPDQVEDLERTTPDTWMRR